jgi:hypothetical protein
VLFAAAIVGYVTTWAQNGRFYVNLRHRPLNYSVPPFTVPLGARGGTTVSVPPLPVRTGAPTNFDLGGVSLGGHPSQIRSLVAQQQSDRRARLARRERPNRLAAPQDELRSNGVSYVQVGEPLAPA